MWILCNLRINYIIFRYFEYKICYKNLMQHRRYYPYGIQRLLQTRLTVSNEPAEKCILLTKRGILTGFYVIKVYINNLSRMNLQIFNFFIIYFILQENFESRPNPNLRTISFIFWGIWADIAQNNSRPSKIRPITQKRRVPVPFLWPPFMSAPT